MSGPHPRTIRMDRAVIVSAETGDVRVILTNPAGDCAYTGISAALALDLARDLVLRVARLREGAAR